MSLTIGVPREIYAGEKRVATVPDVVEKLIKLGFAVRVETDAGAAKFQRRVVPGGRRANRGQRRGIAGPVGHRLQGARAGA